MPPKYQGIAAPVARTEQDFDPGAKFHVPANTPYTRYFLAHILQFQFHRALCKEAGFTGPLYRCSIYGNKAAGAKLAKMLEMGSSRPWPEALATLSGESAMDATAMLDYFAPLKQLLEHAVAEPGEDKRLVALSEVAGARLRESADIVALVLPRVAGTPRTSYHPATKGEALRRLAPSSILQLPLIAPRPALQRMAAVASRLPTYWLDLGQDLAEIPLCVGEILAEVAPTDPGVATRGGESR